MQSLYLAIGMDLKDRRTVVLHIGADRDQALIMGVARAARANVPENTVGVIELSREAPDIRNALLTWAHGVGATDIDEEFIHSFSQMLASLLLPARARQAGDSPSSTTAT